MCLLHAKLTDEVYHLVKNVAKVTGFLGQNKQADAVAPRAKSTAS
jgi:transcription antitermination factor NusG